MKKRTRIEGDAVVHTPKKKGPDRKQKKLFVMTAEERKLAMVKGRADYLLKLQAKESADVALTSAKATAKRADDAFDAARSRLLDLVVDETVSS